MKKYEKGPYIPRQELSLPLVDDLATLKGGLPRVILPPNTKKSLDMKLQRMIVSTRNQETNVSLVRDLVTHRRIYKKIRMKCSALMCFFHATL